MLRAHIRLRSHVSAAMLALAVIVAALGPAITSLPVDVESSTPDTDTENEVAELV